ncbi:MAG: hypothetical protein G3M78_07335 [Candidatus Nitrohelix vancouverensis]|uniref:MBOAT family protein n=1 Tax=Candidatus Nitrohelix vancouverensis TaxID=2705534 RepID=A0A7T0C295_9BACT|nr:MAG: hypothetical protein G3M78_07335 [Candidatus Nitrohelix vancouverensis]
MAIFINPTFWIVAVAVYLALSINVKIRPTLRFGVVNLLALGALLGWLPALGAMAIITLFWGLLRAFSSLSPTEGRTRTLCGFSIIGLLTFFFILHKLNLENSGFLGQLNESAPWARPDLLLPFLATLSFSYVFVRCLDAIHCVCWKKQALMDPISLTGYLIPFHMLLSGPVNSYEEHQAMDADPQPETPTEDSVLLILNAITTGLFYKFVIAEGMRIYYFGMDGAFTVSSWSDASFLVVYVFFDFAGYSRIARGLGLLYNVPTPENFSAPFLSPTVTEFWTRWHMSMGQFVRRNLFTPMQLNLVRWAGVKRAGAVSVFTLILSFGFVGLWHRLSPAWFLWGAGMGILMAIEKQIQSLAFRRGWNRSPGLSLALQCIGPIYVFFALAVSAYFVGEEVFTS